MDNNKLEQAQALARTMQERHFFDLVDLDISSLGEDRLYKILTDYGFVYISNAWQIMVLD